MPGIWKDWALIFPLILRRELIRGLRSCALTTHPKGGWWTSESPGQLNRQSLKKSIVKHHYNNNYKSSCCSCALSHSLYLSLKSLGVLGSSVGILACFLCL